ncbi:MAG: formate/nitrite transporter family protein [candidate division NC10 bacterium]
MTDMGGDRREAPKLDALLPPEMAQRAEDIGARKAAMDGASVFALSVLAGAFIALGAVFSTVALAGAGATPWGAGRVLAGVVFSLGFILVVIGGAELFTGNNLIVMAWASRRVGTASLVRNWILVFAGNAVGAVATACVVYLAGTHRFGGGAVGQVALGVAHAKLQLGFVQAVALGMLCNALVCLAVWLTYSCRTTTDKILAIVPPISAFVAAGFEHSIANLYFIPVALLVAAFDPAFALSKGLEQQAAALSVSGFLVRNLLPVTIGNIIGGTLLVGAVYWFVYLRPRSGR